MTRDRRRRRRARRLTAALIIAAGAFLLLLGLAYSPTLYAKNAMLEGRQAIEEGQDLLVEGDEEAARERFVAARSAFEDAERAANHPAIRVLGGVPFFGRTPQAVRGLAQIGSDIAEAGFSVSDGLSRLPHGLGSLSPRKGKVSLADVERLQGPVARAAEAIADAESVAKDLPVSWVLGPVAQAGTQLRDRLDEAADLSASASAMFSALPRFAGGEGTRRYFVAGQNPAELRGTGGFIGVYSILTARNGRLELERFRDIAALKPPRRVTPVPPELAAVYGGDLTSSVKATNLVPDAPTAAALIEDIWSNSGRGRLDGVVFVDPQALARLLEATGPVRVAELDRTLAAGDAVDYLTNGAYAEFDRTGQEGRKEALGTAAETIWDTFLAQAPPREAMGALTDAAAQGHIVIHATDPSVQAAFQEAGIAGQFRGAEGDLFGSVVNNATGNKVDYFLERELSYEVALQSNGAAEAVAEVRLANTAPKNAPPGYVLSPYEDRLGGQKLGVGDNLSIVGTYCPASCIAGSATVDGKPLGLSEHDENGLTLLSSMLLTRPEQERVLRYDLRTEGVWTPTIAGGTYRLRLLSQRSIIPVSASVRIQLPEGMEVASVSPGITVNGEVLEWSGQVGAGVILEVEFQEPLPRRAITRLIDMLSRPLSGL